MRYSTCLTLLDEYAVHHFKEFDGTKLKPTMKGGLDLGDHDERNKLEG